MTTVQHPTQASPTFTHSVQQRDARSLKNTCYEIAKQALKNSAALTTGGVIGACIGIATGLPLAATITITALAALGIASLFPPTVPAASDLHDKPCKGEKKTHRKHEPSLRSPRSSNLSPRKPLVPPIQIPSPRSSPRSQTSRSATQSARAPEETVPLPTPIVQEEQSNLSTSVIPSFPQPLNIQPFPKDQPLPATAAQLTIQAVSIEATQGASASSSVSSNAQAANTEMSLALICHYERWMKKIAADDFGLTLPPHYIQAKIDDFLTVYCPHLNERAAACTTEQFQYYVLNPIYDRLHSAENRRQFVEECFQLQRADEVKRSPIAYLERQLGYDLPEAEAAAAVQEIQGELDEITPDTNLRDIEVLQEKLRANLNARALETLREELLAEFGEAGRLFIDAIMNDWTCIGTDIKHNLSFLTPERKERIKEKARAAFEKSDQLEEKLIHLRRDFEQGLPADEGLIAAKHTTLKALQEGMPQAKKLEVRAEITKALALQELRNKSRYNGSYIERKVLRALGFSLTKVTDRTELHESMGAFLATLGENQGAWTKSARRLKQEIADYAFETRLTLAGVPRNWHKHIASLIAWAKTVDLEWNDRAHVLQQQPVAEIQALDRLPKARKFLFRQIQTNTRSAIRNELIQSIQHSREFIISRFADQEFSAPDGPLEERLQEIIQPSSQITRRMRGEIEWLTRYQHTFVEEFSQAENPQDALGSGVCFGKSCGLAKSILKHPETPWHALSPGKILPRDRFFQAAYVNHARHSSRYPVDDVRRDSVPTNLKQMKGIDFKPVCVMIHPHAEALFATIKSHLRQIQKSNGGLILCTRDHATLMRIDIKRNIFEFTDPNFGYQKFSPDMPPGQTTDDVIRRMSACFIELVEQVYQINTSPTPVIFISQLVKKRGSEPRDESFYQYPIIEC